MDLVKESLVLCVWHDTQRGQLKAAKASASRELCNSGSKHVALPQRPGPLVKNTKVRNRVCIQDS